MQITFDLPDGVATALAVSQGWEPTVEDTSQPLVDDEYPRIPNPITMQQYIETLAPTYLAKIVLDNGRERIMTEFTSIYNGIEHQVKHGAFDNLILAADLEGIKAVVKSQLD